MRCKACNIVAGNATNGFLEWHEEAALLHDLLDQCFFQLYGAQKGRGIEHGEVVGCIAINPGQQVFNVGVGIGRGPCRLVAHTKNQLHPHGHKLVCFGNVALISRKVKSAFITTRCEVHHLNDLRAPALPEKAGCFPACGFGSRGVDKNVLC